MNNIAIYISSRNNYSLLESFLKRNQAELSDYYFVNIDDFSDEAEVIKGQQICSDYGIPFVKNRARGLQYAAATMIIHLEEVGEEAKYIVWMTHDSHVMTPNFFKTFERLVAEDKLSSFGTVGFNIMGPQCGINKESAAVTNQCGILGRAPLAKLPGRGGWYRRSDMKLSWDIWGGNNAIAVESVVDMMVGINVELFKRHITVSDQYHLFCAFDDICMQFLNKGVYNVALPSLQVWHDQGIKSGKVPIKSASAAKRGDSKHFGDYGPHLKRWKSTWGWERDAVRQTFPAERYPDGLIREFYDLDYTNGPLKTFKL